MAFENQDFLRVVASLIPSSVLLIHQGSAGKSDTSKKNICSININ